MPGPKLPVDCERLECPFESALVQLQREREARVRVEQSIVENVDRQSDILQAMQRQQRDDAADIIELRRQSVAASTDLVDLRTAVEKSIRVSEHTSHHVKSVKYWLAAVAAALSIAAPLIERLYKVLFHDAH